MNKKVKLFLLIVVLLVTSACSKESSEELHSTLEETPKVIERGPFYAPFTGLEEVEENTFRPIIVTINNDVKARPQSGISEADIIYEFITEGGTTRLLALFQSQIPEQVGPIRSARDYFLHVAKGVDAFYVAHGYSPEALQMLKENYVEHVNGMQHDGTLFKRSSDRVAPHNSYISKEAIIQAMEDTNAQMEMKKQSPYNFHASSNDVKMVEDARMITIQNGNSARYTSQYVYDSQTATYERSSNDLTTLDKNSDTVVELANIIVIEAAHDSIDEKDRQRVDLQTGGKAVIFQAGKVQHVQWRNVNGVIVPISEGKPMELVRGKTWIHVLKTGTAENNITITP